jgi:hypothetical protein
VFRPEQARFLEIPQSPLCYWLRPRFLELLAGPTLGDVAHVVQGLATADDKRFVRFHWEAPISEWRRPVRERRWVPFEKGGGYGRWFGHQWWVVDWEDNGRRIKEFGRGRVQNESFYFRDGWTYAYMARGSLGVRWLDALSIFSNLSSALIPKRPVALALIGNSRLPSQVIRALSGKIQLNESYVSRIPVPRAEGIRAECTERLLVEIKRCIVQADPTEREFAEIRCGRRGVRTPWALSTQQALAAVLHSIEGYCERLIFEAYGLDAEDTAAVLAETGTPAGWFPLVEGYDALPDLPEELGDRVELPGGFIEHLAAHGRVALGAAKLAGLKSRMRLLYEAGPGASVAGVVGGVSGSEGVEEESAVVGGAYIPIPPETFVEELSQKLRIHPISVYRLLEELRREAGGLSGPEVKRRVEDYFSVLILRMLGHRWPEQDRHERERGGPMIDPKWVDADGIIPLVSCAGERALIDRLRAYLDERFGAERGPDMEAEVGRILGKTLARWLERDFFARHVSQFRKRPIAWHIRSEQGTFQAIVYYHKFNRDRLHSLRAKYVQDMLEGLERRLAVVLAAGGDSPAAAAERAELEEQIADVRQLDERLRELLEGERREYRIWAPWKEPGEQPRGWDPDINDGVRVNIAPVQRAGLLAAPVLTEKDLRSLLAPQGRS